MKTKLLLVVLATGLSSAAYADTYQVGPTRAQQEPTTAFIDALKSGDVVELDGDHTYPAFSIRTSGITLRGVRVNGKRPVIASSGGFTLHIERSEHVVVEGVEISGGDICFRHYGAYTVLRDALIHHCKNGVLGTDNDSGSLTIEYTEIHSCGSGTQHHQIYMTTDSSAYPGAVFRLQHSYIHGGVGGNNVKSRSERNEIYGNWVEGAYYHELELIGPDIGDPYGAQLPREDSDVVGNVVRTSSTTSWCTIRVGGDGTGGSSGRYRFANNTIVVPSRMSGAIFRFFTQLEAIEMHNNAFVIDGTGNVRMMLQQGIDTDGDSGVWSTGQKVIAGSNNWASTAFTDLPTNWAGTLRGADPGFVNLAGLDFRPTETSPLVDEGNPATASPPGFLFPKPLPLATHEPPRHVPFTVGAAPARIIRGIVDIGAYEYVSATPPPPDAGTPDLPIVPDAGAPDLPLRPDKGTPVEPDAGVPVEPDAGVSVEPDAGSSPAPEIDAGAPQGDAASPEPDASAPKSDEPLIPRPSKTEPAPIAPDKASLNGGCAVSGGGSTSALTLAALLLLALVRSRRP